MAVKRSHGTSDVLVHPYEKVSRRLRILKLALIFVLIAFIIGGLFVLREEFTAENLRFLLRDIGFSSPSLGLDASSLSFDYDTSLRADLYHSDLVLLRRSLLEVYSFSGSRSLSQEVAFSSPALVTGDKYMLAYDIGGSKLGIYNSFSELYTETFDYKIACADLAGDGTFAVVTAEKGYHSALYVYNNEFSRIFRYATADRVVYDVAVCRENPRLVALASVSAVDGDYLTEVHLFDTARAEVKDHFAFDSEMPLKLSFETQGHISLLTDGALHLLDTDGDDDTTCAFSSEDLSGYYAEGVYDILVKNSSVIGTTLDIEVLEKDGASERRTFSIQNQIQDIRVAHDSVYLLSHNSLTVYSLKDSSVKTHKLTNEYKQILPLSGGRIAFVGEGSVSIYMVG
ncbi:MAG: hypothetical protein II328_04095 [Clostridia bacterium]|nr:hypothetical protein [Clostridia bacterium]